MHIPLRISSRLLMAGGLVFGLAGAASGQQPTLRRVYPTGAFGQDSTLRLGSTVTLEVSGLPVGQAGGRSARGLTLYLNGIPLHGLAPLAVYTLADTAAPAAAVRRTAARPAPARADSLGAGGWPGAAAPAAVAPVAAAPPDSSAAPSGALTRVVFALRRDAARDYWALADGAPWQEAHPVRLGLGTARQLLTHPATRRAGTVLLAPGQGWLVGLGLAALAGILLLVAAARSWLLRVPVPRPTDDDGYLLPLADAAPPYSLARAQLAWWGFLVLGGGLASGGLTGALPAVPVATLVLLGISAGTAALAAWAAPTEDPDQRLHSRGWLADLLCDERGLAIQRLQFVLVSLVLGGCLVATVYATGVLPAWPLGLPLLLAFSSLAYLGSKRWWPYRLPAEPALPAAPAVVAPLPAWPAPAPPPAPAPAWPAFAEPAAAAAPVVAVAPAAVAWPEPAAAPQEVFPATPAPPPAEPAPAPAVPVSPPEAPVPAPVAPNLPVVAATLLPAVPDEPASLPDLPNLPAPATAGVADAPAPSPSLADLETGEVLYHEEDDMGPPEGYDAGWPVGG
ncbi:hypothetical protein [Hymenobacter ruricola]|uniref:Uncharacterized protein n=1 Tax=Hymenobacter ruricola TaxID=2791023 RepID=A0ABS0I6T7_9BACT|nr:hypothetical protein [Hymenobacter ruricola]MBF9222684.1 hypothetical protein [Hymenobacter ruricola]